LLVIMYYASVLVYVEYRLLFLFLLGIQFLDIHQHHSIMTKFIIYIYFI
jgi:hypothetical protein